MAAATATLPVLLASLTQSLSLAQEGTSKISAAEHPKDGISLLDVKNELLLSYLQNLVFLILVKLRNSKDASGSGSGTEQKDEPSELDEAVRAKLVELRLYLEKGARPLEEKLRFSIERFLRTAENAQLQKKLSDKKLKSHGSDSEESGSSSEEDDEEDDDEESEEDRKVAAKSKSGGKSAAPNLTNLVDDVTVRPSNRGDGPAGVYKPPKRERKVMETNQSREKGSRRPIRSHTMEEFVASELSSAPIAEPSVGTTIVQGGRRMKTTEERKVESERRDYEETNFVRLPQESKKDRAQKAKQAGRNGRMQFGGEDWRDLGDGVARIDRLTKRKEGGAGTGVRAMLEKSRKRGMDSTDGPRGSGHAVEMGDRFHKKVKMLEGGRRDRGKGR